MHTNSRVPPHQNKIKSLYGVLWVTNFKITLRGIDHISKIRKQHLVQTTELNEFFQK
jgi:hypothetical protein